MIKKITGCLASGLLTLCAGQALATDTSEEIAPESGTLRTEQSLVKTRKFMIAAANPHAVAAGNRILEKGGSAVDAMIAAQLVLTLVEPQSSGIGGGAFVVYYDNKQQQLTTFDGRETAPLAATETLFTDNKGQPLKFYDAVVGGRSVGTPGVLKLMSQMHQRYGKRPWKELFQPAIELSNQGFIVSERLATLVANDQQRLSRYPETQAYFFPHGQPLKQGDLLKNKALANTLSLIAEKGVDAFYQGQIGRDIVAKVRSVEDNPGILSLKDLKQYQVKERPPVCMDYRSYDICGMGPPSSGALTIGQMLGMLSHYDLAKLGPEALESWRLIGGASRLAFADRGLYMADSDFVDMPLGLLNKDYLAQRAALLKREDALDKVLAGTPPGSPTITQAYDQSIELPSTTHISIVDDQGNALSMTSSIENGFGSRLMVRGFLLNNQLTDFSFVAEKAGKPVANRVEPGKRPRSSMSPTIVMNNDKPYMVIGSPGGSRIIGYVANTLIAHLDWQMPINEAIELPHLINPFGTYQIEQGTSAVKLAEPLEALGYKVSVRGLNSGLHGIVMTKEGLEGAADSRREGTVAGG